MSLLCLPEELIRIIIRSMEDGVLELVCSKLYGIVSEVVDSKSIDTAIRKQ